MRNRTEMEQREELTPAPDGQPLGSAAALATGFPGLTGRRIITSRAAISRSLWC
ncbi:MAG: hypothetical protein U0Y68_15925 [Blastocatellia bacterium]